MSDRREFMKHCGLAGLTTLSSASRGFSASSAQGGSDRILIVIHLQGGADGLNLVPPVSTSSGSAGERYRQLRPGIAWDAGTSPLVNLSGVSDFKLHPELAFLGSRFGSGELAIVQKVGLPAVERSHFKAMDTMSRGRSDTTTHSDGRGWLGRLNDLVSATGAANLEIMGVGVPKLLDFNATGPAPLVVRRLDRFGLTNYLGASESAYRTSILQQMLGLNSPYERPAPAVARQKLPIALDRAAAFQNIATLPLVGSYFLPLETSEAIGVALSDIARVIKNDVTNPTAPATPRLFYTAMKGFDTHSREEVSGVSSKPTLGMRMASLSRALQGLHADLVALGRWNRTAILLTTEFGRRNQENVTEGTDHGYGFHSFILGGALSLTAQGGLLGNPVTAADLNHEDLPVEIDYRSVLKKLLADWLLLPASTVNSLFSDFTPAPNEPSLPIF